MATIAPPSTNFLLGTQFLLSFPNLSGITYFCQGINIPGLMTGEILVETPQQTQYHAGDKLIYDPLSVTFYADENLYGWKQIHDWMRGLTKPVDYSEYRAQKTKGLYHDAVVAVLSSTNKPMMRFSFKNCFPTSLSPIFMSTIDTSSEPITMDATFRFDYFTVEEV